MMIFLRLMLALWGVLPMIIKLDIWQSLMLVIMVLRILLQVRYGLFPAGSIGWIVSEESFFKPLKKVINYFKVRASVGMVGNDNNGNNRFLYLPDAYIFE